MNPVLAKPSAHLGQLLEDVALTFREETALIEVSRHTEVHRLSYTAMHRRSQSLAAWLIAEGLKPGDRLAILMTNRSAWLITAAAAFRAGAVLVPLDYKLTTTEVDALLEHARPAWVVAEYGLSKKLSWSGRKLVCDAPTKVADVQRFEHVPDGVCGVVHRDPEHDATIVYSSGTGGTPKGCRLSHRAYLAQIDSLLQLYPMAPGQRFFSILPTNHAIDFMCGFLAPFCCGATVVHQRTLRPEFLRSTLKRYGITHMAAVPLILKSLRTAIQERLDELPTLQRTVIDGLIGANAALTEDRPRPMVSQRLLKPLLAPLGGKLQLVFTGGAFVEPELASFFYRLGIGVVIGYGLTEAGTVVAVNDLAPFRADSVGAAVPGTSIRVDGDRIGEVQIHGPTVMTGYLDEPELTAASFTEDGWLRTGDLGWLDAAGHLHLVGRSRNIIVTAGGKNLYPEDIEIAFGSIDTEGFAVFAQDFVWPGSCGLGAEALIAVVQEVAAPLEALRTANRVLPEHKRLRAVLAWPEAFPRTASMKLKRQELARILREESSPDHLVQL